MSTEVTTATNNTWTSVALNSESLGFDTDGFHDNSTNNSRFTIPSGKGGYYLMMGSFAFGGGANFQQQGRILLNGTTSLVENQNTTQGGGTGDCNVWVYTFYNLSAGDYVEMQCRQNSGTNKNLQSSLSWTGVTKFGLIKVGD